MGCCGLSPAAGADGYHVLIADSAESIAEDSSFSWSPCLPPGATRWASEGPPRYVCSDERPDPARYVQTIMAAITERNGRASSTPRPRLWIVFRQLGRLFDFPA